MKKIFIITNSGWNIANFRYDLLKKILKKTNNLIISCPPDNYIKKITKNKIKYLPISYKRNSYSFLQNFKIILFYYKNFIKEKPSDILLYTIKPNIFASISNLFINEKIQIFNFITGIGNLYFESYFKKKIIIFLYKIAFLKSNKVIFQNNNDLNYFVSNKIISKKKCLIIPGSGVDINFFKFKKLNIKNKFNLNFLCISRLIKHKGIDEFIQAAKMIKKEYPDTTFTLIGSIDLEYNNSLNKESLNDLNSYINHINFTEDIINFLEKCDCFVLPSYREGTSRSLLEAASTGRPIVTTDVPGCNNIVLDNYNGYLCNPKDITSLYEKLKKMINTEFIIRKKMGINGRKLIEDTFSNDIVNNKILELIDL